MKKLRLIPIFLVLMISLSACQSDGNKQGDIYEKIHQCYYNMPSYEAECTISAYTKSGENSYDCKVIYNSVNDSYKLVSDDMTIFVNNDKTVISRGQSTIESVSTKEDMYIFVNSFFKSYYESEDASLSAASMDEGTLHLLECQIMNPTEYLSSMKLWVDSDSALPTKMQVIGKDELVHTEVVFKSFKINK